MYLRTTFSRLATESSSNGKIVYNDILSESFNISVRMWKTFEVTCTAALSAHSLFVDKFQTYLSKLPATKILCRF